MNALTNIQTIITMVSGIATVLALFVIVIELFKNLELSKSSFEDHIFSQFLDISYTVPYKVMVGCDDIEVSESHEEAIFNFLMLSNHCVKLADQGRIRKVAWEELKNTIVLNINQKSFLSVWRKTLVEQPNRFDRLPDLLFNKNLLDEQVMENIS